MPNLENNTSDNNPASIWFLDEPINAGSNGMAILADLILSVHNTKNIQLKGEKTYE